MTVLSLGDALRLLEHGDVEVEGRLVNASNATFYGTVTLDGASANCVYKPRAGERPLWDFPDGTLAQREVAAYAVSEATGWELVPPTVLREGPFGPGMCQLWIDAAPDEDLVDVVALAQLGAGWLPVVEALGPGGRPVTLVHADDPRLRQLAALDAVLNNADRKGGHILVREDGHLFGVDHGVCFNVEDKLRTVLWGWAGTPFAEPELEVLRRLLDDVERDGPLARRLHGLLTQAEVRSTRARLRRLVRSARFPRPSEDWPAIPWPPF